MHSEINNAQDYEQALFALQRVYKRCRMYVEPATWREFTSVEAGNIRPAAIIITPDDSIFGVRRGLDGSIRASGYALNPQKQFWYALSNDEFMALKNKPQSKLKRTFIDEIIHQHWYDMIGRYFDAAIANFES